MKKNHLQKTCVYFFLTIFLGLSQTAIAGDFELIWQEEFDSTDLDRDYWSYLINGNGNGNNELQYYTDAAENCRIDDGKLIITAKKEQYDWAGYTSARINTKGKIEFKYKSIRVKARLPAGRGTWPAIWALGTNINQVSWPACGEIDIMEHVGYNPGHIHGTIHTEAYNGMIGTQKGGSINIPDFSEEYHVYRIDWYNNKIEWYVDDQKYYTYYKEEDADWETWPFDQEFYLIINLAIGGNWGGVQGVDDTIFPVEMGIDWVKVYDMPILELDSYEKKLKVLHENNTLDESDTLTIFNIGAGELNPLTVETSAEWLTLEWIENTGNEQLLKISPNSIVKELAPGKYQTEIAVISTNSNNLNCRVELQIGENLVLNKTASASSYYSLPIFNISNKPENAVDGDLVTKWRSVGDGNEWLQIDLKNNYKINTVQIYWADEISTILGYEYELQLSNDSSFTDYSVIGQKKYSRGGTETAATDTSVSGQYLRFYGHKSGEFSNYSIREMEVFGSESFTTGIDRKNDGLVNYSIKNYPNPFNNTTIIEYALGKRADVKVLIFNLAGEKVTTLVDSRHDAGLYSSPWTPSESSGIYIYKMLVNNKIVDSRKMILLK